MIKLTASYSLKLPTDVEYSSEQAGACIELEIGEGDAQSIPEKLSGLWKMLRQSVETELHRRPGEANAGAQPHNGQMAPVNGNNGFGTGAGGGRNNGSNGNGAHAFQGNAQHGGNGNGSHGNGAGNAFAPNNGNGAHGNGNSAYTGNDPNSTATRKQIGLLLALARRNRNWNATQTKDAVKQHYHCDLNSLTKSQASQIIDQLQGKVMN